MNKKWCNLLEIKLYAIDEILHNWGNMQNVHILYNTYKSIGEISLFNIYMNKVKLLYKGQRTFRHNTLVCMYWT